MMLRIALFVAALLLLAYISRTSLAAPGSHGFYRFFAWTCILVLSFQNIVSIRQWFGDPFSLRQIASWILLVGSIVPAVSGFYLLRRFGKPDAQARQQESLLIGLENTTTLVTSGVYKYIRHPLYSSLLLLLWGVFLKKPSLVGGLVALTGSVFLVATAKAEEVENERYFGPAYLAYMKRTKMFVPFVL